MSDVNNFMLYTAPSGEVRVHVYLQDDSLWLIQKAIIELFGVNVPAISKHLTNLFKECELQENSVVSHLKQLLLMVRITNSTLYE
ncbi:hypothetical protein U3A58_21270 [Algoriphagus sp. C2-6-M1]|uniref:hypothetical protein n=1 Tax=Algoriphagus persicinus TaxID=3108754 RepID=UPI002B3F6C4D|nr:hypothetical protein [Algoriphagus sp. C2-6-M1]MEB2782924.1 hypothetical protein [Algoriphagus sp. C2-6-M1]